MKTQEETMRYRMSSRDVFYGGGVVNGARNITLMEDLCHRMMAKLYGNQGRCTCVEQVRLYDPIFAGDYIEYKARVLEQDGKVCKIECRSFKVAVLPEEPEFPSSIDVLEDPTITAAVTFVFESRE